MIPRHEGKCDMKLETPRCVPTVVQALELACGHVHRVAVLEGHRGVLHKCLQPDQVPWPARWP